MTKEEEKGIATICVFVIIYVNAWFTASSCISAPENDLQLLKYLRKYRHVSPKLAEVALMKFLSHLWYLSEELIALSLFVDNVSIQTKNKIVLTMTRKGDDCACRHSKLNTVSIDGKSLQDFAYEKTQRFFAITGLTSTFFQYDAEFGTEVKNK